MANVIGEPLSGFVKNQIKKRQEIQGSGVTSYRSSKEIAYLNSKTAWIKMASAVEISSDRINAELLHIDFHGSYLARYAILFDGVSRLPKDSKELIPRGSTPGKNAIWNLYDGAYTVNASKSSKVSEFGLVPMPGIESVDIKCINRGSIKKATVKLKCFSPEQFKIIDLLYLRIGYTMFIEWGWAPYFSNDGTFNSNYHTLIEAEDGFFAQKWRTSESYSGFLAQIQGYRESKDGNYDGILCKVTNFNWTISQEGSYDISIDLISLGDVIESLKTNITPSYKMSKFLKETYALFKEEEDTGEEDQNVLPSPSDNILSAYLFIQKLYLTQDNNPTSGYTEEELSPSNAQVYSTINGNKLLLGGVFVRPPEDGFVVVDDTEINIDIGAGIQEKKDVVYLNYNNEKDGEINDAGFYMRFGHLLKFLENYVIPKIEGSNTPILKIDYDMWKNKMYTFPYQVSLDPRVCIVKGHELVSRKDFWPTLKNFKNNTDPDKTCAYQMNIYISHNQIINSLQSNTDDKGNVALFAFLSDICSALNKALGGLNNLEPIIDEETNTLRIIDGSYSSAQQPGYALELYGYNGDQSNFVRNFSIKTEITNDFAIMSTVGSTAGGYVKGTENTMFSKWNKGLTDRFKEKVVPANKESREKQEDGRDDPNASYYKEFWKGLYNAFGLTNKDTWSLLDLVGAGSDENAALNDEIIDKNIATVTEFYKYCNAKLQELDEKYASPANGFVPISLNVTIDGISGIKIYNEVNVDTRFLPSNYPEALRFIITQVNHKIDNNDWETSFETVAITNSGNDNKKIYKPNTTFVNRQIRSGNNNNNSNNNTNDDQNQNNNTNADPPTKGKVIEGNTADFWALIAICALEDGDAQARADVAQSIYNRIGSGKYSAKSIKSVIVATFQYEPTFVKGSKKGIVSQEWKSIDSKKTAIKALQYSKGWSSETASNALKDSYEALKNPNNQKQAQKFIQGRTDFLSENQGLPGPRNKKDPSRKAVMRDSNRPNNVFAWNFNYKTNKVYDPPPPSWFNEYANQF